MKSILKLAVLGVLSTFALSSAYAGVECKAHNAKGKTWVGKAETSSEASERAMKKCKHHSKHGKKCVVKSCKAEGEGRHEEHERRHAEHERHHEKLDWHCTSMNAHSERFVAMGVSRHHAAEQSLGYCFAQSPAGTECSMLGCSYRG